MIIDYLFDYDYYRELTNSYQYVDVIVMILMYFILDINLYLNK